ncbi:hypothetical protein TSUD_09780 [Trifolium subterraneum]|nr:hypothetical protein TSUD_09780 [Trifolium subterraneum]
MSLQLRTTVNLLPSGVILTEICTPFLWVVLACFAVFGWRLSVMGVLVLASFCFPPRSEFGKGEFRFVTIGATGCILVAARWLRAWDLSCCVSLGVVVTAADLIWSCGGGRGGFEWRGVGGGAKVGSGAAEEC